MLYLIGIGLNNEKDITVNGLEAVKKCDLIYLESYTSKLQVVVEDLEKFYDKKRVRIFKKLFCYPIKIFNFSFISNYIRGIQLSNYNFSLRNLKLFTITSFFFF